MKTYKCKVCGEVFTVKDGNLHIRSAVTNLKFVKCHITADFMLCNGSNNARFNTHLFISRTIKNLFYIAKIFIPTRKITQKGTDCIDAQ